MPPIKQSYPEVDVLLRYCEEQWNHIRHLENQRATFTNLVLVIAVGVIGFITQQGISIAILPLTIALIILGLYGAFASYKFYERYKLHKTLEDSWVGEVDRLLPKAKLKKLAAEASEKHKQRFRVTSRVHVHTVWITFNILIALAGILLTLFSLGIL